MIDFELEAAINRWARCESMPSGKVMIYVGVV